MAWDTVAASPLSKHNVVLILVESANVSSLVSHTRTQVNALNDPTPSLGDLINQCLDHGAFGGEKNGLGNHYLNAHFLLNVPILLLWYLPLTQTDSCPKRAASMLGKPLC